MLYLTKLSQFIAELFNVIIGFSNVTMKNIGNHTITKEFHGFHAFPTSGIYTKRWSHANWQDTIKDIFEIEKQHPCAKNICLYCE